jgi:hypothetical protein
MIQSIAVARRSWRFVQHRYKIPLKYVLLHPTPNEMSKWVMDAPTGVVIPRIESNVLFDEWQAVPGIQRTEQQARQVADDVYAVVTGLARSCNTTRDFWRLYINPENPPIEIFNMALEDKNEGIQIFKLLATVAFGVAFWNESEDVMRTGSQAVRDHRNGLRITTLTANSKLFRNHGFSLHAKGPHNQCRVPTARNVVRSLGLDVAELAIELAAVMSILSPDGDPHGNRFPQGRPSNLLSIPDVELVQTVSERLLQGLYADGQCFVDDVFRYLANWRSAPAERQRVAQLSGLWAQLAILEACYFYSDATTLSGYGTEEMPVDALAVDALISSMIDDVQAEAARDFGIRIWVEADMVDWEYFE